MRRFDKNSHKEFLWTSKKQKFSFSPLRNGMPNESRGISRNALWRHFRKLEKWKFTFKAMEIFMSISQNSNEIFSFFSLKNKHRECEEYCNILEATSAIEILCLFFVVEHKWNYFHIFWRETSLKSNQCWNVLLRFSSDLFRQHDLHEFGLVLYETRCRLNGKTWNKIKHIST